MASTERLLDPVEGAQRMMAPFAARISSAAPPRALELFYGKLPDYIGLSPDEVVTAIGVQVGRMNDTEREILAADVQSIQSGATYGANGVNYRHPGIYFEIVEETVEEAGE